MYKIGLDLSIRSTGITINDGDTCRFFIVTDNITKKVQKRGSEYIYITLWSRMKDTTIDKEVIKANNIYNIFNSIIEIIRKVPICDIDIINIEGISYGSSNTSSIMELAGLNYLIRIWCIENNIIFNCVPPTHLKKFATGNGAAVKDVVVNSFLKLHPEMEDEMKAGIKIDDIADSFFLSVFE